MLRVLGSFLDKSYTQFFAAKEEWLKIKKSAANIIRDVSRGVAENDVNADSLNSLSHSGMLHIPC